MQGLFIDRAQWIHYTVGVCKGDRCGITNCGEFFIQILAQSGMNDCSRVCAVFAGNYSWSGSNKKLSLALNELNLLRFAS
jgi:hypothetical protein